MLVRVYVGERAHMWEYVHMCGSVHGGLERVLEPLDLESWAIVNCHSAWVLGTKL